MRLLGAIFTPPFRGLSFAVWAYFIVCFCVHPHSLMLRGDLPDADDYMYLAQLGDWLGGQNWFDNAQHRLDPLAQVPIDFSRLTQLPMAALTLAFIPFSGKAAASLLMAMLLPLLLFAILLFALRWTADMAMNQAASRATAFVAIFATYLVYQFSPGHIDHHGLTALLVILGTGFAARMLCQPQHLRWRWVAD